MGLRPKGNGEMRGLVMTIEERNAKIVEAIRSGKSLRAIGRRYGLVHERIRQIGIDAGVQSAYCAVFYTDDEIKKLEASYRRGIRPAHIPSDRRTPGAVRAALIRYGIHSPERQHPLRSDDDKAFVKRHYHKRHVAEIAAELGTTRNAIIGLAYRMGLSKSKADSHA